MLEWTRRDGALAHVRVEASRVRARLGLRGFDRATRGDAWLEKTGFFTLAIVWIACRVVALCALNNFSNLTVRFSILLLCPVCFSEWVGYGQIRRAGETAARDTSNNTDQEVFVHPAMFDVSIFILFTSNRVSRGALDP